MRIFFANYAGHDLLNLKDFEYDELINITEGSVNIFNIERLDYDISKSLLDNEFDPTTDCIICSGNVIINYRIGVILGKSSMNPKVILYNSKRKIYQFLNQ